MRVSVDGRVATDLPITDRALHYGDGLFETLLVRAGRPCQWPRHLARLGRGCARLGMPSPTPALLESEINAVLDGVEEGVLKLVLTRGSGGRGYRPPSHPAPRRLLLLYPHVPRPDWRAGVVVRYCRTPVSTNPALAGLKHLNRLDAVLARQEWTDSAIAEGLMRTPDGAICSGTMSNLLLWDGARLLTPALVDAGIAGTVRDIALEQAERQGIAWQQQRLFAEDLERARALFLTNAVIGVWPVARLGDHAYDLARQPWDLLHAVRAAAHSPG
ncbi:aminodeoxychorismate lyase [Marichromatium bheemlicum]|uniref:aminodeoxychorismate lyase n=1 Tax=Marichromatium bheemlicum TaxID=365339 RepID=UPI001FE9A416|nr:aminodeoxychorismate lyase [Marichromatium bheemlicum]